MATEEKRDRSLALWSAWAGLIGAVIGGLITGGATYLIAQQQLDADRDAAGRQEHQAVALKFSRAENELLLAERTFDAENPPLEVKALRARQRALDRAFLDLNRAVADVQVLATPAVGIASLNLVFAHGDYVEALRTLAYDRVLQLAGGDAVAQLAGQDAFVRKRVAQDRRQTRRVWAFVREQRTEFLDTMRTELAE